MSTRSHPIRLIWLHRRQASRSQETALPTWASVLPVVNFTRNGTLLGQVRATSVTNTTLVVPFPTTQGVFGNTVPGLSAGPVTVEAYNQTASGNSSWGLVGSTSLTVNDTRTPPSPVSTRSHPIQLIWLHRRQVLRCQETASPTWASACPWSTSLATAAARSGPRHLGHQHNSRRAVPHDPRHFQ